MKTHNPERLNQVLAEAHNADNARHVVSREELLGLLTDHDPAAPTIGWPAWATGGAWVTAACAMIVAAVLLSTPKPLSAMDRMAVAIQRVVSFSWRFESVYISQAGEGRAVKDMSLGRWRRDPLGLHASIRVIESKGPNTDPPGRPTVLVDIEETHRRDLGVLIDHRRKNYWWIHDGYDGTTTPGGSPQVLIFKVRERRGRVLSELGRKEIDGREAEGFVIVLDGHNPVSDLGPATPESEEGQEAGWDWRDVEVEVWVDAKTDLPIEFLCKRTGADFETTYRVSDLQWNVDFGPEAFEPRAPGEGYTETDGDPGGHE